MKRIPGIKRKDSLKKVSSSSDAFMKEKENESKISTNSVPSNPSNVQETVDEEFEDFEFTEDENETTLIENQKVVNNQEDQVVTENDADQSTNQENTIVSDTLTPTVSDEAPQSNKEDDMKEDKLDKEQHQDTPKNSEISTEKLGSEPPLQTTSPASDASERRSIFDVIQSMPTPLEETNKRPRNGSNQPNKSHHGFKPTAQILYKKQEDEQEPPKPRINISIGGLGNFKPNHSNENKTVNNEQNQNQTKNASTALANNEPKPENKPHDEQQSSHTEKLQKGVIDSSKNSLQFEKTIKNDDNKQQTKSTKNTQESAVKSDIKNDVRNDVADNTLATPIANGNDAIIQNLMKQIADLQKELKELKQQNTVSTPVANQTVPSAPMKIESIVDKFDQLNSSCTYDPEQVSKLVKDFKELATIDESQIYRVANADENAWRPSSDQVDNVKQYLISQYSELFSDIWQANKSKLEKIEQVILSTIKNQFPSLGQKEQETFKRYIMASITGIGILQPLMDDKKVTEILVVDKDKVFCIVDGKTRLTDIKFSDSQELKNLAHDIVDKIGREITINNPHVDAKLENGTRVHIIIPPASANGSVVITMRKPPTATRPIGLKELVATHALSVEMVEFLQMCVRGKANIILYGETNSGKTTITRAMANFFHPDERIISLEDTQELNLPNFHYVPLEAVKRSKEEDSIGIHDLFKDTLRMSPERLLIGEVRGEEGADMIEAMQSGQRGGITTMHAGSPEEVVTRLIIMMSRADFNISEDIMRRMVHSAIDIVIQCRRLPDGTRKVTRITELIPIEQAMQQNIYPFRDIFRFEVENIEEDEDGNIVKMTGQHRYLAHLSHEKRLRYFEFGVKIPEKFGGSKP